MSELEAFVPGRRLVLLVAPYETATSAEYYARRDAQRRVIADGLGYVFAPDLWCRSLNDDVPTERALALSLSADLARVVASAGGRCVQVGTRITEGMASDLAAWREIRGAPEPEVWA